MNDFFTRKYNAFLTPPRLSNPLSAELFVNFFSLFSVFSKNIAKFQQTSSFPRRRSTEKLETISTPPSSSLSSRNRPRTDVNLKSLDTRVSMEMFILCWSFLNYSPNTFYIFQLPSLKHIFSLLTSHWQFDNTLDVHIRYWKNLCLRICFTLFYNGHGSGHLNRGQSFEKALKYENCKKNSFTNDLDVKVVVYSN